MVVRYRNAGAWGAGEGMRLTSLQVDENFFTLEERVQDIIDNPIPGLGIANLSLVGTRTLRVTMEDNTTHDFLIPIAAPHWRDEWTPDTDYLALDRFWVDGVGLFLVLRDHTSAEAFDPNATEEDTDGIHDLYYQEFGLAGLAAPVGFIEDSAYTLALAQLNHFLVCTADTSGCEVTIPDNDVVEIPVGSEYHFFPAGGTVSIFGSGDVFIYPVEGFLFETAGTGRPITVKKVATDDWCVFGALAVEVTA
jgi:hypothetical protein